MDGVESNDLVRDSIGLQESVPALDRETEASKKTGDESKPPRTEASSKQQEEEEKEMDEASKPDEVDIYASMTFEELCSEGKKSTVGEKVNPFKRAAIKVWRWCINPCKQIYLYGQTVKPPTNYLMLQFRTYNSSFDVPNANGDYLAPHLRDALMPERGRAMREKLPRIKIMHDMTQWPVFGLPGIVNFIDARTQWFDEAVASAIDDGITQIVLVAAGFDTRAYRMGKEGVMFYEIDLPEASEKKQALVKDLIPESRYRWPIFVAADLSCVSLTEAMEGTGFDQKKPCLIIIEGLLYYLKPQAVKELLNSASTISAQGSRLQFDFLRLSTVAGDVFNPGYDTMRLSVYNKREPFRSGINHRPAALKALLKLFGYKLIEAPTAKEQCEKYLKREFKKRPGATLQPAYGYARGEKL